MALLDGHGSDLPGKGQIVETAGIQKTGEWLPISTKPAFRLSLLGIQGTGKSWLVKNKILPIFSPYYLVIDPNDEYQGFNRYIPKYSEDPELYKQEIELLIRKVIIPSCDTMEEQKARGKRKVRALKLLVIEEADLLAPSQKLINPMVRRMVVVSRHLDLNIIFIARRPTDLNTYIMDTSDFLVSFMQTGANAKKVIRNISDGAEITMGSMSFENHDFLYFDRNRQYWNPSADELCQILATEAGLVPA